MQRDAIMLTLGQGFLNKMYPGGRDAVIKALDRTNTGEYVWMQFCGSGVPTVRVEYCYLIWDGKVQYRLNVQRYVSKHTGAFGDGGVARQYKNRNMVIMEGPAIKAPYDIPKKGFQGVRYTEFLF